MKEKVKESAGLKYHQIKTSKTATHKVAAQAKPGGVVLAVQLEQIRNGFDVFIERQVGLFELLQQRLPKGTDDGIHLCAASGRVGE